VIFDLDGTLLDHAGSVKDALNEWLPTLQIAPSDDHAEAWFLAEQRHYPSWQAGEITFAEQRRRRLREFLPLIGIAPGEDAQLDEIFTGYLAHYQAAWRKFDDVDPTLAAIAEMSLQTAVLSNGISHQQNAKLKALGLLDCVGPVFTAEDLGIAKPNPDTYLVVCAKLEVDPGAALHVGDLHDLDVLAPRAAGLQALHLDRANAGPHDEPHRITSLNQLPKWLAPD
jgi:putative hydrolase of the HAD superfamily